MLVPARFRVQNFRNIDDSGWVPIERVTALVGRNESGKTALLKALHKFNPATPEAYNPQREFPRDRYTRDFKNPADCPVCSVAFEITGPLHASIQALFKGGKTPTKQSAPATMMARSKSNSDPAYPTRTSLPALCSRR